MPWIDSDNTFFLHTSPSKYTLSLKNTLSQIVITLTIIGMLRHTLPFGQWLIVAMTNEACVKSSMKPHAYKVVINHSHEISGRIILSRLLHSRAPHLGMMNGDVQSDLSTLAFKNGEQLEYFHSKILRLQQEITISGETVYNLFQPMTDLFSTRALIWVHFKTVHYFSQPIFGLFSYLKNAQHNLVIELCRAPFFPQKYCTGIY